ncbi:pbsp domain-containing protein [Purpureocillium lavendulum]|uniref:Pbsp domain-containing protein n=1 Tax=Purpureocillium lavendulum TaxID=1247861 RepID=A0AB34G6Y1_9HYPO|nr:pbsp domain-containing protein [Purpureocillium lavendulum]
MPVSPPGTTPAPSTTRIFQPAMTPVVQPPPGASSSFKGSKPCDGGSSSDGQSDSCSCNDTCTSAAHARSKFPLPKLRLEIRDLSHPGARLFLDSVNATECMTTAANNLLRLLYGSPADPTTTAPPTRSVTLILRDMPGVAYTTGSELDDDHKEVHFSLPYVARVPAPRAPAEVAGVVTHELVHCCQYNGFGTCPGGLIEGVADWVRLRCGLVPPHWTRSADGDWDGGYQKTAYFLDYLEARFGDGLVRRLNEKLRIQRYEADSFWCELTGYGVDELWKDYGESLKGGKGGATDGGAPTTSGS